MRWLEPDMTLETGEPYHAADFIPFDMPESLDRLQGSDMMTFTPPSAVYWGPRRPPFDMNVREDVIRAYTELISHADSGLQTRYMNRDLLKRVWPDLLLDRRRVRPAWERMFPELVE